MPSYINTATHNQPAEMVECIQFNLSNPSNPSNTTPIVSTFELINHHGQPVKFNKPCVMGIINMSPNSFYQPYTTVDTAIDAIANMVAAGVDMIDIGGEATNPQVDIDSQKPNTQAEMDRILPLLHAVKTRFPLWVSIDTSSAKVMKAAIDAGADMINDQRALKDPAALAEVANTKAAVCLMHFFHAPRMPGSSSPTTLLQQILQELIHSINRCIEAGISPQRIVIDPGFGQGNYGKNCHENYYLLAYLSAFTELGYPVLVGWSRKSMIGDVLSNAPVSERLSGSLAAATIAALSGAAIIRVHDVQETLDAMKVTRAFMAEQS